MPLNKINQTEPLAEFPGATWNTLVDIGRQALADTLGPTQKMPSKQKLLAKNASGSDAPAGAILKFTGVVIVKNKVVLTFAQPNDTLQPVYGIATEAIADGKIGAYKVLDPCRAYYLDSDGTPTFGESWGPHSGQWYLRKGRPGFEILGNHDGTSVEARVTVLPTTGRLVAGKLDAVLTAAGTATVSIWGGTPGSETDTGLNITAVRGNWLMGTGTSIASGKKVTCEWFGAGWQVVGAEC